MPDFQASSRRKWEKVKKKAQKPAIQPFEIPACMCFCNPALRGSDYQWTSWGLAIRHLRDHVGLDQATFGSLVQGYTRGQIARYETEQAEPPIDFWIKLMRCFGLSVDWAMTGKGLPYVGGFKDCEDRKRYHNWQYLRLQSEEFLNELRGR